MTESITMGAYLRGARRRRRVSIERAAEETRIRAAFLMRMESDEFDFLAPAYVRGFIRTYARYLDVDPEPLVEEFDRRFGRHRVDTSQMVALQRRSRSIPKERRRFNNWAVAGVVAGLILVALAWVGVASQPDERTPTAITLEEAATPTPTADAGAVAASPTVSPTATDDAELALTKGIELVVDATTAPSWLEVYADGEQLFYDTLATGQSMTFSAQDKMFIRLGFPQGVELTVNGQEIGSPGGQDPIELTLPNDLEGLI